MARVVEVAADGNPENRRPLDEPSHRPRRRDPDRVREDDLVGAGDDEPLCEICDDTRVDLALERAAERDADRRRRRPVGDRQDPLDPGRGLRQRRVAVALVEGLGGRERHVDAVERRRGEPLPAALVQHEPGELGLNVADRRDDLLRTGHLRHALVADEADRLDPRQAGGREASNELGPDVGSERLRLVLKPVAGADVAERDAHASRLLVLEGFERIELGRTARREDRSEDPDHDRRDREDDDLRRSEARTR